MADKEKGKGKTDAQLQVESTGELVVAVPSAEPTGKPQAVTVDPATLPKAENMPSPFASDRSVPNDTLVSDEDRKAADESKPVTDTDSKKKSNLYQEAVVRHGEGVYSIGAIESEYDTGLVDVMTTTGRWTGLPLKNKDNAEGLLYPYAELGKGK